MSPVQRPVERERYREAAPLHPCRCGVLIAHRGVCRACAERGFR